MWLKFIKNIDFYYLSPAANDFSVLFCQNLIQNMFLCNFSMIFVKFLHLNSPQVELSGGRLKWSDWMTFENKLSGRLKERSQIPSQKWLKKNKNTFSQNLDLGDPEELDNKLGTQDYLRKQCDRSLWLLWLENHRKVPHPPQAGKTGS